MEKDLPTQARAVIIGGGIVGCSVAYHLTIVFQLTDADETFKVLGTGRYRE